MTARVGNAALLLHYLNMPKKVSLFIHLVLHDGAADQ
jgi:hypothetical protein